MTNKTLGAILRTLVTNNTKDWDTLLSHAKFAYNRSPNTATKYPAFECAFGVNPLLPFTLIDLPK